MSDTPATSLSSFAQLFAEADACQLAVPVAVAGGVRRHVRRGRLVKSRPSFCSSA
jgi:hypothetical protein